ncbi:class I SAM-dependent methyltransferase [Mycolicibacterium sediminis]|uniref:SAM-dependent methyltransferase n=1 Tax=Mycolicibacterium sediminis TaxID=1286180 RepID=A0A7I7QV55_9MYCO|nr:class I SAM-dependent methyltransferase [Mycolicibacterium sediminis]BBY30181.1 SAM-dependent methyltransferase [Mycolicibacterium sediminis]
MVDWSGRDYAEVSGLQRAMIVDALADLEVEPGERVLDIGCGDGYLTRIIAERLAGGLAVGVDASPRMVATADAGVDRGPDEPRYVAADARALPFTAAFDVAVSFNALHWVPRQDEALAQIAAALTPAGRATIQVVCAGPRRSLESVAMDVAASGRWRRWFDGFEPPFVHVDPDAFGDLARSAGLTVRRLSVTDREWDFGSRDDFLRWCAVGCTAWTDRLDGADREQFVTDLVDAYEPVAGRPGLFRFTQMRAELKR